MFEVSFKEWMDGWLDGMGGGGSVRIVHGVTY